MDKNIKRMITIAGFAVGLAGTLFLWKNRRLLTVNDVTTGESLDYPELLSRVYNEDRETALDRTERVIRRLPRWRVVLVNREADAIEAEVETLIGHFLDDVTVYVTDLGNHQCRVTIRSRSRQGRGDLGQNAQHIQELQDAMDAELTRRAAI